MNNIDTNSHLFPEYQFICLVNQINVYRPQIQQQCQLNVKEIQLFIIHKSRQPMKKMAKKISCSQQKQRIESRMSQQNFKIYLRIKPMLNVEGTPQILKILSNKKVQITSPYYTTSNNLNQVQKCYTYQEVFDDNVNNSRVFYETMITPINNVLKGFNSTVFIYGMTGSGKTYTMFGSLQSQQQQYQNKTDLKEQEDGLVFMTIDYMFNQIQMQSHIKSQIFVSFYQIYNENIRDLLINQEDQLISPSSLAVMEDPIKGIFVNGLTQIYAEDKYQIKQLIQQGILKRSMNATKSNEVSSRSHAILQFSVKRYVGSNSTDGQQTGVLQSKFFMIDLAGNQKTANNEARRFIEGININKSLLTLGKCLSILAQKKAAYVPFRDSKLTRILKESLGGNSKTVMIACVSASRTFYQQTLNTLKYSSIARKIKNKGVKHNFKLIPKNQIPHNFFQDAKILNCQEVIEANLKDFISRFLCKIQQKLKIQQLLSDLQNSKKQNQKMMELNVNFNTYNKNIHKINDITQILMNQYDKQVRSIQNGYAELAQSINKLVAESLAKHIQKTDIQNKKTIQRTMILEKQISMLKQIIEAQSRKLQQYERQQQSFCQWKKQENEHYCTKKLQNEIISKGDNYMKTDNAINLTSVQHKQSWRNQNKQKKISVNCKQDAVDSRSLDEAFRSSTNSAGSYVMMSSNTNLSPAAPHEKRQQAKINKYQAQKQIVINLNVEQFDTKNKQNFKLSGSQTQSHQCSRDEFVRKLKQTQSKAKAIASQQIQSILKQHETNRYQLGNVQLSMLRKLKFFQRQKAMQKSNSLGKLVPYKYCYNKPYDPLVTRRSIRKC